MSGSTDPKPSPRGEVERSGRSPGCVTAAVLAVVASLFGAVVFTGQYSSCASTAGSEAGFWCLLPIIGMTVTILIATLASAFLATFVAAQVLGSTSAARRLAPILLGGVCLAAGLGALVSVVPRTGGPSTPSGLWATARNSDSALVDRLLTAWTSRDSAAVAELYGVDARLIPNPHSYDAKLAANLGFYAPAWVDLDGIRVAVSLSNTSRDRVGPVTVTENQVPGLAELAAGSRFLHWVTTIRGQWFENVVAVSGDGKIHDHYIDEYYGPDFRRQYGFSQFKTVGASPVPS